MVTADHHASAAAFASDITIGPDLGPHLDNGPAEEPEIGVNDHVITGNQFRQLSDEERQQRLRDGACVYARMSPDQRLTVVSYSVTKHQRWYQSWLPSTSVGTSVGTGCSFQANPTPIRTLTLPLLVPEPLSRPITSTIGK